MAKREKAPKPDEPQRDRKQGASQQYECILACEYGRTIRKGEIIAADFGGKVPERFFRPVKSAPAKEEVEDKTPPPEDETKE